MLIITSDNFSQYYREHIQTVYRIALGIIRIPEEAEDIAADCFTAMINKAEFNDENHLKAWLIITAEHKALNVAKSARMKRTVPLDSLPERSAEPCGRKQELPENCNVPLLLRRYPGQRYRGGGRDKRKQRIPAACAGAETA